MVADARQNTQTDLLLLCGDFQAIRNLHDFPSMAVPAKYRQLGDFWEYYAGIRVAPVLTVVIGGNHECMAYMWELYHGGWLAPNIYFLGAAGSIYVNPTIAVPSAAKPIRLSGMSGIYKSFDYKRGHFETVPFNEKSVKSAYHVREYDVLKLKQLSRRKTKDVVDLFMSHDWPVTITRYGDERKLLQQKPYFRDEAKSGTLGSVPALELLHHLAPAYWFSAHLHVKFSALVSHDKLTQDVRAITPEPSNTAHVVNPDEITLDDDEELEAVNPDKIDLDMDDSDDEEPADDAPCSVAKSDPQAENTPAQEELSNIPEESVDQVEKESEPQAVREKVHELAGTSIEEVAEAKETILAEEESGTVEQDTANPGLETRFLALDKCGFGRDFIQFMEIPTGGPSTGPPRLHFDPEWLAISRAFHQHLPLNSSFAHLPTTSQIDTAMSEARTWIDANIMAQPFDVQTLENGVVLQPMDVEQVQTFCFTAPPHNAPEAAQPNQWFTNMQTEAFAGLIGVENKVNPLPAGGA
ncbi:hypothetical protein QFC22_001271 [Naganishia vaughanmartiniae]|uniref:Uncharacterized protein n=1 Tax=Naganishia vaughanmartiniae TaxID=1424756 RepID=A0ACC2XHH6_9TREE|nr:hypothetical protein QFC22_001271 [Naganishia vaughanmartiniae]